MRPIDADALWQKIHEHGGCGARPMTWDDGWDKAIDDALDCVEAAPTITPTPRWIPVTERLPEPGKKVLVCFQRTLTMAYYMCEDGWRYVGFEAPADAVTHWMPLPAPPEVTP